MTKISITFLIICIISFWGCAGYNAQSFNELSLLKIDLESNNFKVQKLGVQGTGQCSYLFGGADYNGHAYGIPQGDQDIQTQAMKELHKNWSGKGSWFYHNINVEWASYGFQGIYITYQCTITADIYEFDKEYVDYAKRIYR